MPEAHEWVDVVNDEKLSKETFELPIRSTSEFKVLRVQNGQNSTVRLRFCVRTNADDAEALAGAYLRRVGTGNGRLHVRYAQQLAFGEEQEAEGEEN